MLTRLTKVLRLRSAALLAVMYLICVLAPSAAFAFGDENLGAHCLTEPDSGTHIHSKAKADDHSHASTGPSKDANQAGDQDRTDGKNQQCCGLFCVSSLSVNIFPVEQPLLPSSLAKFMAANGTKGNQPERLYRPPISLS